MFTGGAVALRRWGLSELRLRRLTTPIHLPISSSIATSAEEGDSNARTARSGPPPIRVALTESAGRGVFATRAIGAGELIHTAKPIVAHASPSLSHRACYYCLKKLGSQASFTPLGGDGTAVSTSGLSSCYFCSERCRDQSKSPGVEISIHGEETSLYGYIRSNICRQSLHTPTSQFTS